MDLQEIRKKLDKIDGEIVRLFEERMKLCADVAQFKIQTGKAVYDPQREKEKTTLYTRNAIVEALQNTLPELISACLNCYNTLMNQPIEEVKVNIPFGEYANPSFESQVETVTKGKQGGVMSIEAAVEELYGDSRDEEWKAEEVKRLKAEQGIAELEEPGVNMSADDFQVKIKEVEGNAGEGHEPDLADEPEGVPGAAANSQ